MYEIMACDEGDLEGGSYLTYRWRCFRCALWEVGVDTPPVSRLDGSDKSCDERVIEQVHDL